MQIATPTIKRLEFDDHTHAGELFGPHERNLKFIGKLTGIGVESRGSTLTLRGESADVEKAANLVAQLYDLVRAGSPLSEQDIEQGWRVLDAAPDARISDVFRDSGFAVSRKRKIFPKTLTQREYVEAIEESDLVLGIGPAGTGKTYLAVAMAVAALGERRVKRLILTRPAVEAGERLGFLPGDLVEKINPYLRPLYDALHDMLEFRVVQEMLETGRIEVAPLAFMRGRTLNDAFIILDEAQNTTPEQMKMFLTRLGFGSKAVVTGDVTQIDLPDRAPSGLIQASEILEGVAGIRQIRFLEKDVIRHPLVGRIVQAYERFGPAEKKA